MRAGTDRRPLGKRGQRQARLLRLFAVVALWLLLQPVSYAAQPEPEEAFEFNDLPLQELVRREVDLAHASLGEEGLHPIAIGQDTTHSALTYRVQAAYYRGSNGDGGDRGRISYRDLDGDLVPQDPTHSPRA